MVKVSVILPVYNVAPYLDETFESLLNQSLKEIEIIAVNDGSTDKSEDIIRKYAAQDSRITSYSQKNQGQSAARNLALQHATGEYIYMMDSDDVLADKDALQICYEYAERCKADFIFFDGDTLQEEGAAQLSWDYHRTQDLKEMKAYSGEFLLNMMLDNSKHNCVVWLLLINHNYLKRIGLDFYPGIIHEDELFTTKLTLQSNNIFCLKRSFVKHRVRSASTMGKHYSKRNINCYLTVIDELLKWQNSPIIQKFAKYTLSKVFYTGHQIPFKEKFSVFSRAMKSGYLKYIGWKSVFVFWLKQKD
ncbi:MAG: glycosyltransferase [Prevotella sp.]|nr:glycosyltransferase [Prevotella sp.]